MSKVASVIHSAPLTASEGGARRLCSAMLEQISARSPCPQKLRRSLEAKNGCTDLAAELAPVTAVTDST